MIGQNGKKQYMHN